MVDSDYSPAIYGEDEDELRRRAAEYPPPMPISPTPAPALGSIEDLESRVKPRVSDSGYAPVASVSAASPGAPAVESVASPGAAPAAPSQHPAADRLQKLITQGAPPVQPLHGFKKGLDVLGRILAPHLEERLRYGPQNEYAHQRNADELEVKDEQEMHPQPKPKEEKWKNVAGISDKQGRVLQEEENSGQMRWAPNIEGAQPLKEPAANEKDKDISDYLAANKLEDTPTNREKARGDIASRGKTPNDFEQFYKDWIKENNFPDTAHNRLIARKEFAAAGQAPPHEPRQLAVTNDGTVIELKPGMHVPAGTKTASQYGKPTADEQRRGDLAENLNENLDKLEEIASRRPDLFGPLAGRWTSAKAMIGSDDPDVAALGTIKHQIGMVQISVHGMRSAHGIDGAAESIFNSFHNSAEATKAAIKAARDSVKTFTGDVERAQGKQGASKEGKPQGGGKTLKYNPTTGKLE